MEDSDADDADIVPPSPPGSEAEVWLDTSAFYGNRHRGSDLRLDDGTADVMFSEKTMRSNLILRGGWLLPTGDPDPRGLAGKAGRDEGMMLEVCPHGRESMAHVYPEILVDMCPGPCFAGRTVSMRSRMYGPTGNEGCSVEQWHRGWAFVVLPGGVGEIWGVVKTADWLRKNARNDFGP